MKMKVLLIGGTRFLGLEIARAFAAHGAEVSTLNRGNHPAGPGIAESIRCDKNDRDAFAAVLKRQRWDVIVDTILQAEDLAFVAETVGSRVGHFIHTGSLGVYGDSRAIPACENIPLSEYSGDDCVVFNYKIQQDQVLLRAFTEQRFPATILRCSYICGPGDFLLDGWGGRNAEFFRLLANHEPVVLPGDGSALLHPGDVRDLGRAFLHAALRPASIGQVYNIGGSHAVMIRDYVAKIADLLGSRSPITYAPAAEVLARYPGFTNERGMRFSMQHMCGSVEKIARELDWRPQIPLERSLRESLEWMQANPR